MRKMGQLEMRTMYIQTWLWQHSEEDGTVGDADGVYRDEAMAPH